VLVLVDSRTESHLMVERWKVRMSNLEVENADMGRRLLREVDGEESVFKNEKRPAGRFLSHHFVVILLRNNRDRRIGWRDFGMELSSGRPFRFPGDLMGYVHHSMFLALAKFVGSPDADPEGEARLLGEAGIETFEEEEERLKDDEEHEISGRFIVAHGLQDEEEDGWDENTEEGDGEEGERQLRS
jgi:hypothetical protein